MSPLLGEVCPSVRIVACGPPLDAAIGAMLTRYVEDHGRCAARQATLLVALPRALNLDGVPGARRVL